MQSVVIDAADRLWILDTGRVFTPDGHTLVQSSFGGPKLISIDLSTNQVLQTILFPQTVAFPDSYLNDVRFDLRPGVTAAGKGIAYITDSSSEGRNGLIILDLGTGESWRHVSATEAVRPDAGFVGWVAGQAVYSYDAGAAQATFFPIGSDGIALSADGASLFFCPLSARRLYSVSTALLRERGPASELLAQQGTLYRVRVLLFHVLTVHPMLCAFFLDPFLPRGLQSLSYLNFVTRSSCTCRVTIIDLTSMTGSKRLQRWTRNGLQRTHLHGKL